MPPTLACATLLVLSLACARAPGRATVPAGDGARAMPAPAVDHHQHLFSPAIAALRAGASAQRDTFLAPALVALLDSAGIRRAAVLSVAYMYGSPARTVEDEYTKVRAENDWTAAQAAAYPGRLRAFCGVNPLKDYALAEIGRCAGDARFGRGIKFHFANSDVRLDDSAHVARLRAVFREMNARRMAVLVHMRANLNNRRPYGAAQARVFLEELLPLVPVVPVQVAHMAGTGPGYADPPSDSAVAVLAEAVQRGDARTRGLWFDVASSADRAITPENAARLVGRIRQVGIQRVLYGSDAPLSSSHVPRAAWAAFRQLPLTDEELARIAANVGPWMR